MFGLLKGWFGEKGAQIGMWMGLDGKIYRRIHDIVIPARGGTTQIDHLLVSIYGIFVIETKNMDGWIFGEERSSKWTQCIYGKKFQFQNPLHQNYRHTRALAEYLNLPPETLRSVVFFIGECEFKTPMPPNVLERGICRYIQSFREPIFSLAQADAIFGSLLEAKRQPAITRSMHVAGLKVRHEGEVCPKCGSSLVLRTARRGSNTGNQFFGCSSYPKCRYTRAG